MNLAAWQTLAEPAHEELVRLAMGTDAKDVAAVARLRKVCADAEVVRAALMLGEARRKAVAKFGAARAATLWADPAGVEMATSRLVAGYKWRMMLAAWSGHDMLDVCCGIGGDAMTLGDELMRVTPVDSDPVRAWMAEQNCGRAAVCADAGDVALVDGPFHIDPARRGAAGRVWRLDDLSPGPPVWTRFIEHARKTGYGGGIKLGPGADLDDVQRRFPDTQIEVISENGRLVQAMVWFGGFGPDGGTRCATLVRGDAETAGWARFNSVAGEKDTGAPPRVEGGAALRYVYEPDDSVERASLLGVLCAKAEMPMLHPRVGLLTSDCLITNAPMLTPFEVLAEMPWDEKRVRGELERLGAGIVEVKTRGGVVDTDVVQKSLRGKGDAALVVFVLRMGSVVRGIVARRVGR